MQIKFQDSYTTRVDSGITLPFQLSLIVGEGYNEKEIEITNLTTSIYRIPQFMYEIQELKNLMMKIDGDMTEQVDVVGGLLK
ncbi:hypothetical protein [Paracerasibacillus soli]|uniref:Uncharacterized protein n=1 Tax=Paracerasibacillus soli TaxID=480284 RepID=A0ABU5CMR4_9BACI|nr:hypothetical protein [Virgibacillus soli]MDY0407662.1 hypothetical protein [Virgibacillus soli]